ncbi:MerR family transcriptional regulator [Salipaludibacillus sp. HK11]|uniref:MerR family transcriptional regulator n=1 Tax=Salipaludibacillus sp. HK11 TaxID=3394320 RepID=UPI0039FB8E17
MKKMIYKIGELAKKAGISIRTLHHYDHIGLLSPTFKDEHGHRHYEDNDLFLLHQITTWKELGFSLKEIHQILTSPCENDMLKSQLAFIQEEQQRLTHMKNQLVSIQNMRKIDGEIKWELLLKSKYISENDSTKRELFISEQFSEQQLPLLNHLPKMENNDSKTLEWFDIINQLQDHMKNESPSSANVQRLIKRIAEKSQDIFADDDDAAEQFWSIRKSTEQSNQMGLYPLDENLLSFTEEAWEFFIEKEKKVKR